jgi:hypothetical protein
MPPAAPVTNAVFPAISTRPPDSNLALAPAAVRRQAHVLIPAYASKAMIYCVIPPELETELYAKLVDYYKDNPNVTVIVDRREGEDRRKHNEYGGNRQTRDRRRARVTGTFPSVDPPPEA